MTDVVITPINTTVEISGITIVRDTSNSNATQVTTQVTTTTALGGNRVVCFENGVISYANTQTTAEILGFTVNAASANSTVLIQSNGELDGFYGLTVGLPVYLADNGLITQTVPASNRLQCLGVAVSSTKILIQIHQQFRLLPESILSAFLATNPYTAQVADTVVAVDLANQSRLYDFAKANFYAPSSTSLINFATANSVDPATMLEKTYTNYNGNSLSTTGGTVLVPERILIRGGYTSIGYVANDPIVQGKCRSQINTFAISSRTRWLFDMTFKLTGKELTDAYPMTPVGQSPCSLWQIKSLAHPTIVMDTDTYALDSSKLLLSFDSNLDNVSGGTRICEAVINPNTDVSVQIEILLDERSTGYLKITVNGVVITDGQRQTAQVAAVNPYQVSYMTYMWNNAVPVNYSRFINFSKNLVYKLS